MMQSVDIREKFLRFFEAAGHKRVRSSSLIPASDPTLLFTNSGMVQFKNCFLGQENPGYTKATTSQKCVRAGGKHNDLENVGFTPRHHTFFEMLGNFSFGDYFKKEAIAFAWELLTKQFALPADKLHITVFENDDEALELWKKQGIPAARIHKLGEKDNFWAMGDTGPCGPCTEIHYDWGTQYAKPGSDATPGTDDKRFLEIWNLVFMQFNRDTDGKLHPLPKPSVDTGAGLERLAAVFQNVYSNYDSDLFTPLKKSIEKATGKVYGQNESHDGSIRVIMDHVRAGTFLIGDGVTPSNEGRGYVLRRILRRAIRHGKNLGKDTPFIHSVVPAVVQSLGSFYPEIAGKNQTLIEEVLKEEETKFHETLHRGLGELESSIAATKKAKKTVLPGEVAFKLYDTFGFPLDLTEVISREHGLTVDQSSFEKSMGQQRERSGGKALGEFGGQLGSSALVSDKSHFSGYEATQGEGKVLNILDKTGKTLLKKLSEGESGYVTFDHTPFYAESGGQVGDKGHIQGKDFLADVLDTTKAGNAIAHHLLIKKGALNQGQSYQLLVDADKRKATAINHTATHLMHAALRALPDIGPRVKQAGSLVNEEMLRFDFSCPRALTAEEIQAVEKSVNDEISKDEDVTTTEMSFDDAKKTGAVAFFDDKYGDRVRVIRVGSKENPYSIEFCGGTHLTRSGEVRVFKVLSESSIASGTRRIIALTGKNAQEYLFEKNRMLDSLANELRVQPEQLPIKVNQLLKENKTLKQTLDQERLRAAQGASGSGASQPLWEKSKTIKGYTVVMDTIASADPKILRSLVDQVRDKLKEKTLVCLVSQQDSKVFVCVGVTPDMNPRFDAGKIVKEIATEVGGSGGGRSDFAQAGGTRPEGIPKVFDKLETWMQAQN